MHGGEVAVVRVEFRVVSSHTYSICARFGPTRVRFLGMVEYHMMTSIFGNSEFRVLKFLFQINFAAHVLFQFSRVLLSSQLCSRSIRLWFQRKISLLSSSTYPLWRTRVLVIGKGWNSWWKLGWTKEGYLQYKGGFWSVFCNSISALNFWALHK